MYVFKFSPVQATSRGRDGTVVAGLILILIQPNSDQVFLKPFPRLSPL